MLPLILIRCRGARRTSQVTGPERPARWSGPTWWFMGMGARLRGGRWLAAILAGCLAAAAQSAPALNHELALARAYPVETLRTALLPPGDWHPFPRFADRAAWGSLPAELRQRFIELGQEALIQPWPALPATLYLEYAREGNRSRYEAVYFERRQRLHVLTVAECLEGQRRFLDGVANALWAICEESTWCLPAHLSVQKAGAGLADVNEPIVDLFAGETAVSLAWTWYVLGAELDRVAPVLRRRVRQELDRRILTPVLERDDFGWMGFGASSRSGRPNNWNPWINSSVLAAALVLEPDADRRAQLVHKALRSLDCFLGPHPPDGSCDEGPGYWTRAGGSVLDCLDLLASASGGKVTVFDRPLVQEIGRFIYRAHICGDYYVALGDCAPRLEVDRNLVYRYGRQIQDPHLKALGTQGATAAAIFESVGTRSMGRLLWALFDTGEMLAQPPAREPLLRDVWLGDPDLQMMAARTEGGTCAGFYVAAWGGHNAQSHNHNDVGNVIVFARGQPVLVDAGVATYTRQTFSSRRYELWPMQSAYHNLPTINGVQQAAGRSYAARNVTHQATDAFAQLELDLASAYPDQAQVRSWVRRVRLDRQGPKPGVELVDRFELEQVKGETAQHLLTPMAVDASRPGELRLTGPAQPGATPLRVTIEYEAGKLAPTVEELVLEDPSLERAWGRSLTRVTLRATTKALADTWTLRVGW